MFRKIIAAAFLVCLGTVTLAQSVDKVNLASKSAEIQWEYLVVTVDELTNNNPSRIDPVPNLENVGKKIETERNFGYTGDYQTFYSRLSEKYTVQGALDSLGKISWELVTIIPPQISQGNTQGNTLLFFKRFYKAERSKLEAEQLKVKVNNSVTQNARKPFEFVELDTAEALQNLRSVENNASTRLELALQDIKDVPISKIETRAYFRENSEPQIEARIIIDGSSILLKDSNKYRASEAQTYLRQIATDIFNKIGLRKSDKEIFSNSDYFDPSFNAPRVQIRVTLIVSAEGKSKQVAVGVISGNWADIANK